MTLILSSEEKLKSFNIFCQVEAIKYQQPVVLLYFCLKAAKLLLNRQIMTDGGTLSLSQGKFKIFT
jgi:hypothetical protein